MGAALRDVIFAPRRVQPCFRAQGLGLGVRAGPCTQFIIVGAAALPLLDCPPLPHIPILRDHCDVVFAPRHVQP